MNSPVVLVTGALTGIGRAMALAFAKAGAPVAVSGRRVAEGQVLEPRLSRQPRCDMRLTIGDLAPR